MPLKWVRERDGQHNGRPMYDYSCTVGHVRFHICSTTDAGFGLSIYDHKAQKYLLGHGICWFGTLGRCKEQAEKINAKLETENA